MAYFKILAKEVSFYDANMALIDVTQPAINWTGANDRATIVTSPDYDGYLRVSGNYFTNPITWGLTSLSNVEYSQWRFEISRLSADSRYYLDVTGSGTPIGYSPATSIYSSAVTVGYTDGTGRDIANFGTGINDVTYSIDANTGNLILQNAPRTYTSKSSAQYGPSNWYPYVQLSVPGILRDLASQEQMQQIEQVTGNGQIIRFKENGQVKRKYYTKGLGFWQQVKRT